MNELDALNMLLRSIGNAPVNSVTSPQPDTVNARTTLDRIRKRAQAKGWWFNVDYNVTFARDALTHIPVPKEIISLKADQNKFIVIRDNKMYDNYNNTYKFGCDILARQVIRLLDWDSMPDTMQYYCAYFANSEFVRDELEDPQKESDLRGSASQALTEVKNQHLRDGGYNMFNQGRVIKARAGVQPYHRNNKRFYGDPDV